MRSSSKKGRPNVARSELIGLRVAVLSRHAGWNGLEGLVVDETMRTILVELDSGPVEASQAETDRGRRRGLVKRVPKPGNRFEFLVGDERVVVEGHDIAFRPEDRTKRAR